MNAESWGQQAGEAKRHLRLARTLCAALTIGLLMAAAGRVGYRAAQWRGNSEAARAAAVTGRAPDPERVKAVVGMLRDASLTVEVLRQLAAEDGEVGEQARNALAHLLERCR